MICQFKSVKEFINCMIDHEGHLFCDKYGRQWKYENYGFTSKDIGCSSKHQDGLKNVHLFGTYIQKFEPLK